MRSLLLLRHAKSSWDDPALEDFDRPLAKRGLNDAPLIGAEIARRGWLPDLALVSPAMRANQTWELASAAFGEPPQTRFEQGLYMAEAPALLDLLHKAPDTANCLLVIGHNPGMEKFAVSMASPESKEKALKRMEKKFPTAALARFTFNGPWSDLRPGSARLTHFVRAKDLG